MKSSLISTIINYCSLFILLLVPFGNSFSQDDSLDVNVIDSSAIDVLQIDSLDNIPLTSPFEHYYTKIPLSEASQNYDRINTNGKISDFHKVPNTREINNSRVTDPHKLLTKNAIDTINNIIWDVEQKTGFEMAVVCLNSIGDNDPQMWGTDLFNYWGIGSAETENGFLILVVNDVHKISFVVGRGAESTITDLQGARIRDNEMIPYFKENDYVTGVIRGVQIVADVFYGTPDAYYANDEFNLSEDEFDDFLLSDSNNQSIKAESFFSSSLFLAYLFPLIFFLAIYVILLLISLFVKNLHRKYHLLKVFTLLIFPILFPIPFLGLYFLNKSLMRRWRNTERFSEDTTTYMIKLGENEDDKFLNKGQIKEEYLKSIDYDVWATEDGSDFLVLRYKKWFSGFKKCPKCKFRTFNLEYNRVISSATYNSSGTGEKKYSCQNCSHSVIKTYRIPRKSPPSTSSSTGYGGSSGSSYSSSSSSGSSYGGGSSGGGGGTSSW